MVENMGPALSAGSGASPPRVSAVFDWLARAQAEPRQAYREWTGCGVALLPLGRRFNAVRLPARLVHAGVGTADPDVVTATLTELLHGPVIHNSPLQTYHALLEPYPPHRWAYAHVAPMLGTGQFLGVPAADLTGPTGLHWAVRPHAVGALCSPPSVAALAALGVRLLPRPADIR
ncbi:hypothetical protein ACFVYR_21335 [Streptomyces sp. NPDC058284]|uniref:hypothetical protein n=1 Tax=unclassified Streptomyces TaxID=2593676 RepID=UPI0036505663